MIKAVAFSDGRGNVPSSACATYIIITNTDDPLEPAKAYHSAKKLKECTNNKAEYEGAILAAKKALSLNAESIELYTDSKLVYNQVLGGNGFSEKGMHLKIHRDYLVQLFGRFKRYKIFWVPRNQNKVADKLCREVITLKGESKINRRVNLPRTRYEMEN